MSALEQDPTLEPESRRLVASRHGMKMRQSLAQLEQEFLFQRERTLKEQEQAQLRAERQKRKRFHARERRRGTKRFWLLAFTLMLTAVLVTIVMFATLYLLLA